MTTEELHGIDLAVAKVIGWKPKKQCAPVWGSCNLESGHKGGHNAYADASKFSFQPTRSRADAMGVLEWCLKRTDILLTDTNGVMGVNNPDREIDAETLPLAICKFALEVGRAKP